MPEDDDCWNHYNDYNHQHKVHCLSRIKINRLLFLWFFSSGTWRKKVFLAQTYRRSHIAYQYLLYLYIPNFQKVLYCSLLKFTRWVGYIAQLILFVEIAWFVLIINSSNHQYWDVNVTQLLGSSNPKTILFVQFRHILCR